MPSLLLEEDLGSSKRNQMGKVGKGRRRGRDESEVLEEIVVIEVAIDRIHLARKYSLKYGMRG